MRKKVLYVITKNNFGGAQRYVYDLATLLPQDDYDVCVAFGNAGERQEGAVTLKEKLDEKNIRTIQIKNFCRDISIRHEIAVFFELLRIVRKEKPDTLHVTSSKAGGIGALVGRLTRTKRIIFTSHGLAYDELWRPAWQRFLIKTATWLTIFLSHNTIQITQDTTDRANSLPFLKGKSVLIHNGRTTPAFVGKEEAREKLLPSLKGQNELWIGAISELTINKNIHSLIKALGILHRKGLHPELVICSDGEEKERLAQLEHEENITEHVHILEYVEAAARYLTAFDIYALPSFKEGLPYVLMEAGFASLPVVTSNINGITDLVQNKKTGLLTDTDPESIAAALKTLLTNKTLRQKYGSALFSHIHTTFSIKRMVERTTELY